MWLLRIYIGLVALQIAMEVLQTAKKRDIPHFLALTTVVYIEIQ